MQLEVTSIIDPIGVFYCIDKPSPKRETSAYLRQVLSLFKLMPHVDGLVYTTLYTRSLRAVLGWVNNTKAPQRPIGCWFNKDFIRYPFWKQLSDFTRRLSSLLSRVANYFWFSWGQLSWNIALLHLKWKGPYDQRILAKFGYVDQLIVGHYKSGC